MPRTDGPPKRSYMYIHNKLSSIVAQIAQKQEKMIFYFLHKLSYTHKYNDITDFFKKIMATINHANPDGMKQKQTLQN